MVRKQCRIAFGVGVEDGPGHPLRLTNDIGGLFGIAAHLVGEALAVPVHLDAAVDDQRPGLYQPACRADAMPLIGAEIGGRRPQQFTERKRIALRADMPAIGGVGHFGNVCGDAILRRAEAVCREDGGGAADRPTLAPDGGDASITFDKQAIHPVARRDLDAASGARRQQVSLQRFARQHRRDMIAMARMARIDELGQQAQVQALFLDQPVDGRPGLFGDAERHRGVGASVRLRQDVRGKTRAVIVRYPGITLYARSGGGYHRHRPGGISAWYGIRLQYEDVGAGLACRHRGDQPASAAADDRDAGLPLEPGRGGRQDCDHSGCRHAGPARVRDHLSRDHMETVEHSLPR